MNAKANPQNISRLAFEFEKFIRNIAFEFAVVNFEEIDELIKKHLASVSRYIEMSRAAVVLYDHEKRERKFVYEYLDPQVKVNHSLLGMVTSYDNQSLLTETLHAGKVFRIKQITDIPKAYESDISIMQTLKIESYFAVPIFSDGTVIGSIGFGSEVPVSEEISNELLELELDLVTTFAKILAGHLIRRQIQNALAKEQKLLSSIMENSNTAIIVLETSGKIVYANPISESILGIAITDIVNRTYDAPQWKATSLDGGPWTDEDQPFTRILKSKKPVTDVRHAIEDQYGQKKYLSINGSPIFTELGELARIVFLVTDITDSISKDIALLESEFKYRMIAENSLTLVYDLDLDSKKISWAGSIQEITGYSPEEYQSIDFLGWMEMIHPEDQGIVNVTLNYCIQNQKKFSIEYRYRTKNGNYIHIEDQGLIIFDKNQNAKRMLGAMIDRTERYNAVTELRNQEETLRLALQSASMGIWKWDIQRNEITWSERVYEIFRFSREFISVSFEEMIQMTHPEDKKRLLNQISELMEKDNLSNEFFVQYRLQFNEGDVVYVESTGKLFRDKEGLPLKLIGTISDITDRKKSENALKQSEHRFQTFYQFSNEAIIIFKEKKLEIVDTNQAFLSLFLYDKFELEKKKTRKMIGLETFRELRRLIREENKTESLEIIAYKKGNIPFPAQVLVRRYLDNDEYLIAFNIFDTSAFKEVIELRQINEEISKRNKIIEHQKTELQLTLDHLKKTQSQLVQSEKMALLGQLVAGVAHEINNPIGAIKAANRNLEEWGKEYREIYEEVQINYRMLLPDQKALYEEALHLIQSTSNFFTGMQERKLKKRNLEILASFTGLSSHQEEIADRWVDIGIGEIHPKFKDLFLHEKMPLFLEYFNLESIYHRNTRTIHTAIERVSKIIYALKNFSHFDRHGKKEKTSIIESLDVVFTIYENQIKKGIELIKDYEEIPMIECYPDDLLHVWTNLIYNSFQAMEFKGTLTVRIRNLEKEVSIAISDTGAGIPEEIQPQIFEPFFTTKKLGDGSGLGLDIVKKIVEKHEGRIVFQSIPMETTFTVYLPK